MKFQFISDCHSHSDCSPDGRSAATEMLAAAAERGLYAYALTDHCEAHQYEKRFAERTPLAKQTMAELKSNAPKGMRFLCGIELGQPFRNTELADKIAADPAYDFIIGSLHHVREDVDFGYYLRRMRDGGDPAPADVVDTYMKHYFAEQQELIAWGKFDSLAHITYPLRYLFPADSAPTYRPWQELLEQTLAALIAKDKALELNTSCIWRTDRPTLPDLEILQLYRSMGGRLVTIGSDAHCAEDVAKGIEQGMELLQTAGFTEFTIFEKRTPVAVPLR